MAGHDQPKKHILFLVSSMEGGGAERVAALLCNNWVEQGYEVTLMPTFSGRGECIYPLDLRVRLEFLADHVGTTNRTLWTKLRRLLALRKAIKNFSPDVVVSFLTNINVIAIIASMGTGISVIVSERSYPPHSPLHWFWPVMRRLTYPKATCVVAQTEMAKTWIENHCPGSNTEVIPNPLVWPLPVSDPVIEPKNWILPHRKLLLAVGRLDSEKGFDLLIDSFAHIVNDLPDWDLVILGEGSKRKVLETMRDNHGFEKCIFLPGRAGNVGAWYERADLYVMSSRYEGFPNTLLEALAYGVPVVSFDCETGPRDIITHGEDGLLVPFSKGVEGLSSALKDMMLNDKKRQQMGNKAKDIRQHFDMHQISILWDQVLE